MGVQPARKGSCPNLLHEQQPQVTVHPAGESREAKTLQVIAAIYTENLNGSIKHSNLRQPIFNPCSCKGQFALVAGLALSEVIVVLVCVINNSPGKLAVEGLQHTCMRAIS